MVKYTMPYNSYSGVPWRLDIDLPGYTGDPIQIQGSTSGDCVVEWEGDVDTPFGDTSFVTTKLSADIVNNGQIDMFELQNLEDLEARALLYRGEELYFEGFVVPDSISAPLTNAPYPFSFTAICGLSLLEDIDFSVGNVQGGNGIDVRAPFNYVRSILREKLGSSLPIRWSIPYQSVNPAMGEPFAGNVAWSRTGRGYHQPNGVAQSCAYVLDGLVRAFSSRIFQSDGAWWVLHPDTQLQDTFTYSEVVEATAPPEVTQHTWEGGKTLGTEPHRLRDNAGAVMAKPRVGKVTTTYEGAWKDNVIPNGGFDEWLLAQVPIDWTFPPELAVFMGDSLVERPGNSAHLWNPVPESSPQKFKMRGRLPIDGNKLFKTFSWGFTFLPIAGFRYTLSPGGDRIIDWSNDPFRVILSYERSDGMYYLNEFGYWVKEEDLVELTITKQERYTLPSVPGGSKIYYRIEFDNDSNVDGNTKFHWKVERNGDAPLPSYNMQFVHTFSGAMPIHLAVDELRDRFINEGYTIEATGGNYIALNIGIHLTPFQDIYVENDNRKVNYIPFKVDGLALDDIASVAFTGSGQLDVKLPDPGNLPDGEAGTMQIEFIVNAGQEYLIDELYVSLPQATDRYQAVASGAKGEKLNNSLTISSEFSGIRDSNIMTSPFDSNEEYRYAYKNEVSTLTGLNALSIATFFGKASRIVDCSAIAREGNWGFVDAYKLPKVSDESFVAVGASYSTAAEEMDLTVMSGRRDKPTIIQLSNVTDGNHN